MAKHWVRILLMIDDANVGGGQQHLLWLATGLNLSRYKVAVACAPEGFLVDRLREHGIPHFPIVMTNMLSIGTLRRSRAILHEYAPDLLHTHGGTAGFAGRMVCRGLRRPAVVHTYHGLHYLHSGRLVRRELFQLIDRYLLNVTDVTICVAQADQLMGAAAGVAPPGKTVVIHNGVDAARFAPAAPKERSGRFIIGTIGRLHSQKGQRFLLEAVALMIKTCPEMLVRIVGEGGLRPELERHTRALGLAGHVEFLGPRTDTREVLAGFDAFVLPSLWEGLPLVLLEAMAAEKPIVATSVDGVTEVLQDGENALLVPPGDAQALASALLRIRTDDGLCSRLVAAAGNDVRARFSIERMVRQTEEVYERALQR